MKIVFLQDDFPPESAGGAGMVAGSLALELKKRGYDVSVISATREKSNEGKTEWGGMPVYRLYSDYHERWRAWLSLYNPATVKKVKKIFQDLKPDIVHAHNVHYHLSYASLKAAKAARAKVFLTAHDAMLVSYGKLPPDGKTDWLAELKRAKWRFNPFRNLLIRKYLASVERIFAVSNALKKALEAHRVGNVEVVHNAIDADAWLNAPRATFGKPGTLEGKRPIFFGGRISSAKGGDAVIAALPLVLSAVPNAQLLIAGKENEYTRALLHKAQEYGVGHAVEMLGWLSNVQLRSAYAAAEMVLQPSVYFEPFGLIALEAMASKKPVIASPFGGIPEVVSDGDTGILVDPRETEQFSRAIVSLFKNEALALSMGEAGYARAKKEFSFDHQIKKLLHWYEK